MALQSPFPIESPILGSGTKTVSDLVKGDVIALENGHYRQIWAVSAQQLSQIQFLLSDGNVISLNASDDVAVITTVA